MLFGGICIFQLSPPKGGKCNLDKGLRCVYTLFISIEPAQRREVQLFRCAAGKWFQVISIEPAQRREVQRKLIQSPSGVTGIFQLSPPKGGKCNINMLRVWLAVNGISIEPAQRREVQLKAVAAGSSE